MEGIVKRVQILGEGDCTLKAVKMKETLRIIILALIWAFIPSICIQTVLGLFYFVPFSWLLIGLTVVFGLLCVLGALKMSRY
jgi:hypothetical protein